MFIFLVDRYEDNWIANQINKEIILYVPSNIPYYIPVWIWVLLSASIVLGGTTIHNSMSFLTDVAQLGAVNSGYPKIDQKTGDLQDPIDGGTLVPYFWPYFVGIFPEI